MVYYVKQIEFARHTFARHTTEVPRVHEYTVEQSICVSNTFAAAHEWNPWKQRSHAGTNARWRHIARVVFLHAIKQHVCAAIHTKPLLLEKIAYNRHAEWLGSAGLGGR
jgi:hypothetical protein